MLISWTALMQNGLLGHHDTRIMKYYSNKLTMNKNAHRLNKAMVLQFDQGGEIEYLVDDLNTKLLIDGVKVGIIHYFENCGGI